MPESDPILAQEKLGFPWATQDPFLFCVHHRDQFPAGNAQLGPQASLAGRDLGQDFADRDGWNMYHGEVVPGFPAHPHRGFETVTVVRQGRLDHADSLGAAARYGDGDTQWLTTGAGIVHSEMFPLLRGDAPNPVELFQIWLNLPAKRKMAQPAFKMLWDEATPRVQLPGAEVTVVAGTFGGQTATAPPLDSWAAEPGSEVAIWVLKLQPGASLALPPASAGVNRMLYVYGGDAVALAGHSLKAGTSARVKADAALVLQAGTQVCEVLLLQGRPIGEPVAQYGPFVLNDQAGLEKAFADYRRTQFGGWPWPDQAPVHGPDPARFARFPDGSKQAPGT